MLSLVFYVAMVGAAYVVELVFRLLHLIPARRATRLITEGPSRAPRPEVLYAVQAPFQNALLTGRTTQAAWRSKRSFYAVSTQDRTIDPDSRTLYGQAHEGEDDRGQGEPSVARFAP